MSACIKTDHRSPWWGSKGWTQNAALHQCCPPGMHFLSWYFYLFNPFPVDVANKRHLGSAPKSHFCDLTGKAEVIGLSDLMTLFIDPGCLYCKQTQRAFNVFKSTLNWLKIVSEIKSYSKFNWLERGIFSQGLERLALRETLHFHSWRWKG
jgi:hypothetical protein